MTFNRKYAICVKLSRIEFLFAVMKQNTFITKVHQRQSQRNKRIIHDHRLKTFELCGGWWRPYAKIVWATYGFPIH